MVSDKDTERISDFKKSPVKILARRIACKKSIAVNPNFKSLGRAIMDFAENISLIEQVNNIINPIRKNILPSLFFLIAIANWLIMSIPPLIIEISNKIKNSVKTIG